MTYEVNTANAISETLDGETIVINLKSGNYYSMNATGSVIWDGIVARRSVDSIVNSLIQRYDAGQNTIEKAVSAFISDLQKDELIAEATETNDGATEEVMGDKKEFIAPKIDKYDDMREMLLADPIHDVADVGWPNLKKE